MKHIFFVCILVSISVTTPAERNGEVSFPYDYQQLEKEVLQRINVIRNSSNVVPLKWNDTLAKAAQDQAEYIRKTGSLGHLQPVKGKEKLRDRVEFYGGNMQGMGENAAFVIVNKNTVFRSKTGMDTIVVDTYSEIGSQLVTTWMLSEAHKKNIQFPKFKETGLGFAYDSITHKMFAVQVFAFPYAE